MAIHFSPSHLLLDERDLSQCNVFKIFLCLYLMPIRELFLSMEAITLHVLPE